MLLWSVFLSKRKLKIILPQYKVSFLYVSTYIICLAWLHFFTLKEMMKFISSRSKLKTHNLISVLIYVFKKYDAALVLYKLFKNVTLWAKISGSGKIASIPPSIFFTIKFSEIQQQFNKNEFKN